MWLMAAWLEDKGEEERGRGHLAAGWVRLRQASDRLAWQSEALRGSGEAEWGAPAAVGGLPSRGGGGCPQVEHVYV